MKKNKIIISLLAFIILLNITNVINASNEVTEDSNYSFEYQKWLNLTDSEKESSIVPYKYTINLKDKDSSSSVYDINVTANNEDLPISYNTAEHLGITVRNQGISNSCWAISATELFEILYAKTKNLSSTVSFSERHVDYSCSNVFLDNKIDKIRFNRTAGSGGRYEYAMSYYTRGDGPILYNDMEFENNRDTIDISKIQNKTVQAQLEEYVTYPQIYKEYHENGDITYSNGYKINGNNQIVYPSNAIYYTQKQIDDFRDEIKQQIMKYGAVSSYTYHVNPNNYFSQADGYIYGDSYFCNNASITMNHGICIVGWDDNYSRTNFKEDCQPVHDGAYIALNSWGTDWNPGGGYYYISYDDYFVENGMFVLRKCSDIDYDNIYQYDELGYRSSLYSSYDPTTIFGANVFYRDNNSREKLSEIGLLLNDYSDVTVYFNNGKNFNTNQSSSITKLNNLEPGYHTIKLENPILVENTFTIIIKYENTVQAKIPLEAKSLTSAGEKYINVTSNKGESYYSVNRN